MYLIRYMSVMYGKVFLMLPVNECVQLTQYYTVLYA